MIGQSASESHRGGREGQGFTLRLDQAPDNGSGVSLASGVFARDGVKRTAPVHCIATDPRLGAMAPRPHRRVTGHAAAAVPRRTERPPIEGHSGCVLRG